MNAARQTIMSQNDMNHISIKEEQTLFQTLCRICATEQHNDDSMNNLLTSDHNGLYLIDMLQDCLQRPISRDYIFPLNICSSCTSNLIVVHNFRLTYIASEKKLTEMLCYNWKSEGLEQKVDVIIDESETDVKPNYLIDCAAFDVSVRPSKIFDERNDINNCHTSLKFRTEIKPKLKKPKVQCYECYQCKTTFKRITLLQKHITNQHNIAKCWSCSDCHKRYSNRKKLVEHFQKHISKDCDHCSLSITSLRDMRKHYEKNHTDLVVPHQCDRCPKKFVLSAQLRIHLLDHLNKNDKQRDNDGKDTLTSDTPQLPFLCSECGKVFKSKWLLTSHQNVHSSEKQFVCSKCPSRFKWKLALTYHMTIHQRQDRQKHVCETCGSSFTTRSSMKAHTSKLIDIWFVLFSVL